MTGPLTHAQGGLMHCLWSVQSAHTSADYAKIRLSQYRLQEADGYVLPVALMR